LTNTKLHSPIPYFLLTALMGLAPVLNNKYPAQFFPGLSPMWVELIAVFAGIFASVLGFTRFWAILQNRDRSRTLIRQAIESRKKVGSPDDNEITNAGRYVSRMVRNADVDLSEIGPDFTLPSLDRLQSFLPELRREVEKETDAWVRLGVVGTYLGETLCRCSGWQWFFKADPALRQFSYLASGLRKEGKEFDPFAAAADLLTGKRGIKDVLKELS
jgi:hypothetical protein